MGAITEAVSGAVTSLLTRGAGPKASLLPAQQQASGAGSVIVSNERAAKTNVLTYRAWARNSPWIRAAIDIRKNQIASADYEIVPFDVDRPYSKRLARAIKSKFDFPNPQHRSFRAFVTPVINDLLTLDAGCVEIVGSIADPFLWMYPVDGALVRVSTVWDGSRPQAPRYFWYPDGQYHGDSWRNDEFTYIMQNPSTYSVLGISPLEILRFTIEAELQAADYNRRMVSNPVPDGLLHLGEGVPENKIKEFRSEWDIFNRTGGAMAIIGGGKNPSWTQFRQANRDMQYNEWVTYLVRQIAAVYGLSPQDLGLTFDINRSEGDVQQQLSEDRGLRPLADLIQDEFTQQLVWHPMFGGPDNNLCFRFTRLNINESLDRAQINKIAMAGVPYKRPNEARLDEGRQPIGDLNDPDNPFNQVLANTPLGMVRITENPGDIPTPAELAAAKAAKSNPAGTDSKPSPEAPAQPAAKGQEESE